MSPNFDSPERAERAFYDAFSKTDPDAMMSVWATGNDIVCIHPLGDVLVGHAAVAQSWHEIFRSGSGVAIRREVYREIIEGSVAIRIGYEFFDVPGQARAAIVVSNTYRKTDADGWRMILHHASPPQAGVKPRQGSKPAVLH